MRLVRLFSTLGDTGHSATAPHPQSCPSMHTRTSRQTLRLVRLYGVRLPVVTSVTCELLWGAPPCAACGVVDPNQGSNAPLQVEVLKFTYWTTWEVMSVNCED